MSRILPYPLMSLALAVMWLLLVGSTAPRSLIFAALLGLLLPLSLRALEPEKPRIRNPLAILKLTGIVLYDIIRSNFAVMLIIVGYRKRDRVSGFLSIPLDIRDSCGIAMLAVIVTCTPGTLWVQYDSSCGRLLLHVLDLVDEEEWIKLIKHRYERLLMEIFT
jgi:multicomponent K+:H+ antiporter subunit E